MPFGEGFERCARTRGQPPAQQKQRLTARCVPTRMRLPWRKSRADCSRNRPIRGGRDVCKY